MRNHPRKISVFLASPGDLPGERAAFPEVINGLNQWFGLGAGVTFEALMWENLLTPFGRPPQSAINAQVERCDVFILMLHAQWRSNSEHVKKPATSFTEEEFHIAVRRHAENDRPPIIHLLFKTIDPALLAAPDEELAQVLAFKKKLEDYVFALQIEFSSVDHFKTTLEKLLIKSTEAPPHPDHRFLPSLARWDRLRPKTAGTLIRTADVDALKLQFEQTKPKQVLIVGDAGTGKSSIAFTLATSFLNSRTRGVVLVLPLSRQFSLERGWQTREAVHAFLDYLRELPFDYLPSILLIVEDVHEAELGNGYDWIGETRDLSDSFVVVTTRRLVPTTGNDVATDVTTRVKNRWNVDLQELRTHPEESARLMIDSTCSSLPVPTAASDLYSLFANSGRNLFVLQLLLSAWASDPKKAIDMTLAHSAVFHELQRLSKLERSGLPAPLDPAENRLVILVLWMCGAIEVDVNLAFLKKWLGISYPDPVLEYLIDTHEIVDESNSPLLQPRQLVGDHLRQLRHPMWGELAIAAVDESSHSSWVDLRRQLSQRLKSQMPRNVADDASLDHRPSTWLLAAVLIEELSNPDSLGFQCSGMALHDEYVAAVTIYAAYCGDTGIRSDIEISDMLVSLAANARRTSGTDPVQRQQLIQNGFQQLEKAVSLRQNHFSDNPSNDPSRGRILYEQGYYAGMMGRFDDARLLARESKEFDWQRGPDRLRFGAMSAVREAIVAVWQGSYDDAGQILDEALKVLIAGAPAKERSRFVGNAYHARYEIAMAKRATADAGQFLALLTTAFETAGLREQQGLFSSRMKLAEGDADGALAAIATVTSDPIAMKSGENVITARRIEGDALLLKGDIPGAIAKYKSVLPPADVSPRYLDFELQLIEARLAAIAAGLTAAEILKIQRI